MSDKNHYLLHNKVGRMEHVLPRQPQRRWRIQWITGRVHLQIQPKLLLSHTWISIDQWHIILYRRK